MCDFPSWIHLDDGSDVWLEDRDIDLLPPELQSDAHGHTAIKHVYPATRGHDREGWRGVPAAMLDAMQAGRMARIARAAGVALMFPRGGESVEVGYGHVCIVRAGTVSVRQTDGYCYAYSGGTVHSAGQTGGNCVAYSGGTLNSTGQAGGWCHASNGGTVNSTGQTGGDCYAAYGGTLNSTGQTGGNCVACDGGTVNSTGQVGGDCYAYSGGTLNSTGQAGGDCYAGSGGTVIKAEQAAGG